MSSSSRQTTGRSLTLAVALLVASPHARAQQAPPPVLASPPRVIERPPVPQRAPTTTRRQAAASASAARPQFVITLAGDTGFSPNMAPVNPTTSRKGGRTLTFAEAIAPLARDVDGDLNFLNVETVVTDRNDLARDTKGQSGPFNFRSHPNGFAHLVERGFNLFSLANNHSMDFGPEGLRETLKHVGRMERLGLKAHAGIGLNRDEASRSKVVRAREARVGFAAIGIVTNNLARHRAGADSPGQIAYRFDDDFKLVVDRLTQGGADYRVLSIHYGYEGRVRADSDQTTNWRRIAREGINLVVGHHAHVVRGVEMTDNGALVFYGLGNFLHHGTADITGNPICRSYGLFARVHVAKSTDGRWRARAVEAIPVTDTHIRPQRYASIAQSHARVHALNYLAATLDDAADGARGMRFTPQPDGSGLYCVEGADGDGGRIGALCAGWRQPPAIPSNLAGAIADGCAR